MFLQDAEAKLKEIFESSLVESTFLFFSATGVYPPLLFWLVFTVTDLKTASVITGLVTTLCLATALTVLFVLSAYLACLQQLYTSLCGVGIKQWQLFKEYIISGWQRSMQGYFKSVVKL